MFYLVLSAAISQELVCGDHDQAPVPGGFGACAGPNDGWHQILHSLTRSFIRVSVGWSDMPHLRKQLGELQMSVQATVQTRWLDTL